MSREATCPTCGTVFDPVRARVRGGELVLENLDEPMAAGGDAQLRVFP